MTSVKTINFDGSNFYNWKLKMEGYLKMKKLFTIVDGSEKSPSTESDTRRRPSSRASTSSGEGAGVQSSLEQDILGYEDRRQEAWSLLTLSIADSQFKYVRRSKNGDPADLWRILTEHFERNTLANRRLLKQRFHNTRMREGDDVTDFIDVLTTLANQLENLGDRLSDDDMYSALLNGLPDSFEPVETSLDAQRISRFDDAVVIITDFAEKRALKRQAYSAGVKGGDSIYFLDGSTARYGDQLRKKDTKRQTKKQHRRTARVAGPDDECFHCHRKGHFRSDCPTRVDRHQGKQRSKQGGGGKRGGESAAAASGGGSATGGVYDDVDPNLFMVREEESFTLAVGAEDLSTTSPDVSASDSGMDELCSLSSCFGGGAPARAAKQNSRWLLDSGASSHMCWDRRRFVSLQRVSDDLVITLADDRKVKPLGIGTVRLSVLHPTTRQPFDIFLRDTFCIEELAVNLVSVSAITARGKVVEFDGAVCNIKQRSTGDLVLQARRFGKLYVLDTADDKEQYEFSSLCVEEVAAIASASVDNMMLWHERFGHLGSAGIRQLVSDGLVDGISHTSLNGKLGFCAACQKGKSSRLKFPTRTMSRGAHVLDLVHTDVMGPFEVPTARGARYVVTFTDDMSRYRTVYLMKEKSETLDCFVKFHKLATNLLGRGLKVLRSDNGGEFTSDEFNKYCSDHGITRQFSTPRTPEQNGVAERTNRSIMERARAMLHESGLPKSFWGEAVLTAVYLLNRCPSKAVVGMTPYEAWYRIKPNVSHLRAFGCEVFVNVPSEQRRKLDPKAMRCVMLGYDSERKCYRLYDPEGHKLVLSRDVRFNERCKPYNSACGNENHVQLPNSSGSDAPAGRSDAGADEQHLLEDSDSEDGVVARRVGPDQSQRDVVSGGDDSSRGGVPDDGGPDDSGSAPAPRRELPVRNRVVPARYRDDFVAICAGPCCHFTSVDEAVIEALNAADSTSSGVIAPTTYSEAVSGPDRDMWLEAIQSEFDSLERNHTWDVVPLPAGRKAVGCKWVLKVKENPDGSVGRYKARLVAKGFSQIAGVDFTDTFSPVAKFASIRCLLAIAASHGLDLQQMDVNTAFLNGDLEEEIYMKIPDGFPDATARKRGMCLLLRKGLYGLKQASRNWNHSIDEHLRGMGFVTSAADPCIYVLPGEELVYIALYVDDLIIAADNEERIRWIKQSLSERYDMKDLGALQWCLGMSINRCGADIEVEQSKYIGDILRRFHMEDCNPISTPCEPGLRLTKDMSPQSEEERDRMAHVPYKSAVGSLMYAMVATRPDIAFAVSAVSRFMADPGPTHWSAVKRIFRYLKGTQSLGITFSGSDSVAGSVDLFGFCDADWGGDPDTRRSTTGYVFMVNGGPVSWCSKAQHTVALSSTEAEYMALSAACQEALWLRALLGHFRFEQHSATLIHEDNQSCIALAKSLGGHHKRTKHIDIKHHFVKELVESDQIVLTYCATRRMIADCLTKGLTRELFEILVGRLMGLPLDIEVLIPGEPLTKKWSGGPQRSPTQRMSVGNRNYAISALKPQCH